MADFGEQGREAMKAENYKQAVELYTKAIEANPRDEKFFSNRSAAYYKLREGKKALADAEKCIEIDPRWPKGWGRKGDALMALQKYKEAKVAYQKGVELDPSNQLYKDNIQLCNNRIDLVSKQAPVLQTLLHVVSLTTALLNFFTLGRIGILLLLSVASGSAALLMELVRKAGRPRLNPEYLRAVVMQPASGFLMGALLPLLSRSPMASAPQALRSLLYVVKAVNDGSISVPIPQLREKLLQLPRSELVDMAAKFEVLGGILLIVQIVTPARNLLQVMVHWQYLRFRYMLNDDIKRAFAGIHYQISGLLGHPRVPVAVSNLYQRIAAGLHGMADTQAMAQQAQAGRPKCAVM